MKKLIIPLFILLLLSSFAYADYYIDEDILIENDGTAYVKGTSNLDILSIIDAEDEVIEGYTQELTLKQGLLWKFVYKTDQNLSIYDINVILPEFAEIQSVESDAKVSIRASNNRQIINFKGKGEPMDIEVGYVLPNSKQEKEPDYTFYYLVIALILGISIGYFILRKPKKKEKTFHKHEKKQEAITDKLDQTKIDTIKLTLNEAQLKILEALIEKKGEASQTTIKYLTGLPKSSLSRNIELMSQKSIVSKFYNGTSNYIKIHPSMYAVMYTLSDHAKPVEETDEETTEKSEETTEKPKETKNKAEETTEKSEEKTKKSTSESEQ